MSEKPQRVSGTKKETPNVTRRWFMGALGANAAVGAVGGFALLNQPIENINEDVDVPEPKLDVAEEEDESLSGHLEDTHEVVHEESKSIWFNTDVDAYAIVYKRELPHVLPFASEITKNDVHNRSRMQYIGETLVVNGVSFVVQTELKKLFQALPIVESGYDAGEVSEDGARSLMQIMSFVWNEHKDAGMNPQSLTDQMFVINKYLSQINSYFQSRCGEALERIRLNFFDGDTVRFEKEFYVPFFINAYFAGMGTMANVLEWFDGEFRTKSDTIESLSQSELLTGFDVYYMLAHTAFQAATDKNYGDNAFVYTLKTYGASKMLDTNLTQEQKVELLART